MPTIQQVRRERRNARDRINYYLKKAGVPARFSDIRDMLPGIPKNATPEQMVELIREYKSFTPDKIRSYVQGVQDVIEEALEDFDEQQMAPEPFSNIEAYSDMLHGLDPRIGQYFDNCMDYLREFSAFDEDEIDALLSENPEYFEEIRKTYEFYDDSEAGQNTKYWHSHSVINALMSEIFHVFVQG